MPILTVDDFMYSRGDNTPTSILIETDNRFEVARRLTEKKFNRDDISFLQCLKRMEDEGLIKSYKTKVMRLTFDDIWNAPTDTKEVAKHLTTVPC